MPSRDESQKSKVLRFMKLIVSKTAIEMAVKNICRVINSKNALPILGDILCMVDE